MSQPLLVSIHAFRGEGDDGADEITAQMFNVSIHAFRGEGDEDWLDRMADLRVSIHAFRGEGDLEDEPDDNGDTSWFQSTPSGGKATNAITA